MQESLILSRALSLGPIEREEEGDTVRYTNIKLLSPGEWRDSNSRETINYSKDGIRELEITEGATLNLMHDSQNDVSQIGYIDSSSQTIADDGSLAADIVLHRDNAASEYADENLQETLESGGREGFGGPSVEIPADGQEIDYSAEPPELEDGKIDGAALVMQPASETVAFETQTAERAVALSDRQESLILHGDSSGMSETRELMPDSMEDDVAEIADELGVGVDEVAEVLDPLMNEEDTEMADEKDMMRECREMMKEMGYGEEAEEMSDKEMRYMGHGMDMMREMMGDCEEKEMMELMDGMAEMPDMNVYDEDDEDEDAEMSAEHLMERHDLCESAAQAISDGEMTLAEAAEMEDPCWEGYTMVGQKVDENGNEVPNCVPDDDVPDADLSGVEERIEELSSELSELKASKTSVEKELSEAKDRIDELESEPEDPKSLADTNGFEPQYDDTVGSESSW